MRPQPRLPAGLELACAWALVACCAFASASHAESAADYRFVQLTDHRLDDKMARISSGDRPLIVWMSKAALPGSRSADNDFEVMLWDGQTLEQATDDGVDDVRPAINSRRQIAWMKFGMDERTEIFVRHWTEGGALLSQRVTVDAVRDRYPDINDSGLVVWGRSVANQLALFQIGESSFSQSSLYAYRPHINAAGHITFAGRWLRDQQGSLLESWDASDYGYFQFRRAEINDHDHLLIEAARARPEDGIEVPQDMLYWDGTSMRLIHASNRYVGRGDLNNDGVAAFEGRGGLPSSKSGGGDREIFVYFAANDKLIQLTDNDVDDAWPTVASDGTVIWQSKGVWEGATRGQFTGYVGSQCCEDIMAALPRSRDFDGDGVPNRLDNCPVTYNVAQADADSDAVGDACDGGCQGFPLVGDCSSALVNPGLRRAGGGCHQGGGGAGTAIALAPLVGGSAVRRYRRGKRSCRG